ncbi:MAG: sulfotransferase [Sphingomonadaceae bacterium]
MNDRMLDTQSIIESAEIVSGTSGLVDDGLRNRVDTLAGIFRQGTGYSPDQKISTRRQIVKILARRLNIARDVQKHPEILDEQIREPVFIIGFPRTGTSIQQALFTSDPANRGVEAWRVYEPSPPPGERPVTDKRREMASQVVQHFCDTCPGIMTLHPYWDENADTLTEDEDIWTLDFRDNYPVMLCDAPSLAIREGGGDMTEAYHWLKVFMQHQQWKMPRKRWVMKGVEHQRHLSTLFSVFPDAHCFFPHREPEAFLPSNLAIAAVVYDGITSGAVDRPTLAKGYLEDFRRRLDSVMSDPAMDDDRVLHMGFKQFIADPVAAIHQCYEKWGFAWSSEAENAMREWLDNPANASDRYGRHKYTFDPFGVDWKELSPAFDTYRKRYLND